MCKSTKTLGKIIKILKRNVDDFTSGFFSEVFTPQKNRFIFQNFDYVFVIYEKSISLSKTMSYNVHPQFLNQI